MFSIICDKFKDKPEKMFKTAIFVGKFMKKKLL